MSTYDGVLASIDHNRLSAMIQKTTALRTALRRREPRCRICRDAVMCQRVDTLLDWRGIPIILGPGRVHIVTYADILRDLEPLNGGRAPKDRVTYTSLLNHAKRHYDLDGLLNYWGDRVDKEFREVLGIPAWGAAKSAATPGTNQVRQRRSDSDPIGDDVESKLEEI